MNKIRFGIVGTAKIAFEQVIPAMQAGRLTAVTAIASRNPERARKAARELNIPSFYSSYDELLADKSINAVYIPLPNHLHVPWTIKSLEAGKHVLCEKPVAMSTKETKNLAEAAGNHPGLKVMEAFMYRHHPRWKKLKSLAEAEAIGKLKTIHSFFTYYKNDLQNIRFEPGMGGGGLMDVGCYCISLSRWLFGKKPDSIKSIVKNHPVKDVDILTSGLMDFGFGTSTFTCSMHCAGRQYVEVLGTNGRIKMELPFNPPVDKPTYLDLYEDGKPEERIQFDPCNQFTIQGDYFAEKILNNEPIPDNLSLQDSIENMKVIDEIREPGS